MLLREAKRTILHESIFDKKFEVGINYQDKGIEISDHYHDYIELVCQIEGESIHYIDNTEIKLQQNHILIINQSQKHRNAPCDYDVINIVLPKDFLDTMLVESSYDETIIKFKDFISNHKKKDTYLLDNESISILLMLSKLYENSGAEAMYHFRLKLYLVQFLISLNSLYKDFESTTKKQYDLITYIHNNLSTASLNEYAKLINYSPSSASQMIKHDYNTSFIDILQATRLKEVTKLLLSTTYTIDYIMADVGYSNKTYFYNIFRAQFGITPNQYRKNYKRNN